MSQESKNPSWWQTVPGFLTGIAAIITALAGMTGVLYQNGVLGGKEKSSLQDQPPKATVGPAPIASDPSQQLHVSMAPRTRSSGPILDPREPASSVNLVPEELSNSASVSQIQAGHLVYKILAAQLTQYSVGKDGKPSRLALRLAIHVTDVMGIDDYVDGRTIRLMVDGAELHPENSINVAVYAKQMVEAEVLFIVPAQVHRFELLVGRSEDATAKIPIEFKP
jgi:hypothetical protein